MILYHGSYLEIDKPDLSHLRYENPNMQVCFRSEAVLENLYYEGSKIV